MQTNSTKLKSIIFQRYLFEFFLNRSIEISIPSAFNLNGQQKANETTQPL